MAEPGQLPDWLIQLRDRQFGTPEEEPAPQAQSDLAEPTGLQPTESEPAPEPEPQPPGDVLEDLREQIIQADEELEPRPKRTPLEAIKATVRGFSSWQRLVLSILLFMDVAVCGCMLLTMMGKVVFP